jgi:selenocysteine-specific elongation factor
MFRVGDVFVHGPALEALHSVLLDMVKEFHRKNPLVPGMSKEELREGLHLRPEILDAALATLAAGRKVEALGEQVRLPGRGVELSGEEAAARRTIEQAFVTAGLKVPALKEVLAALPVDKTRAQKIVTLLLRDKVLVRLADDLVFHSDALAGLRRRIAEYKSTSAKIDVARFKDLAGVSRKYAIPLLEYLDRERVTRRVGNERVIL